MTASWTRVGVLEAVVRHAVPCNLVLHFFDPYSNFRHTGFDSGIFDVLRFALLSTCFILFGCVGVPYYISSWLRCLSVAFPECLVSSLEGVCSFGFPIFDSCRHPSALSVYLVPLAFLLAPGILTIVLRLRS